MMAFVLIVLTLVIGLIIVTIRLMAKPISECTSTTLYTLEAIKTILGIIGFLILLYAITLL